MRTVTLDDSNEEFPIQQAVIAVGKDGEPLGAPASEANVAALGTKLDTLIAAIGAPGDAADADTLMGQLKQININTAAP